MKKLWILVLCLFLGGSSLSGGADQVDFPDIYIDSSVGDGGVGSQVDPYNDFSDINWTTGGDNSVYDYYDGSPTASVTINLKRGETWGEQLTIGYGGTAAYPIIIQSYGSGAKPIIDGGGVRPYCVYGDSEDYITIDGIKATDWINTGIGIYKGTHWVVQNNTIEDGGNNSAPDHGIRVWHDDGDALSDGIEIKNNIIGTVNTAENQTIGQTGMLLQGVNAALISENTVNTTNTIGIVLGRVGASSVDNTDCIIEGNDVSGSYGMNIWSGRSDGTIARYNRCHNSKGGGISYSYDSDNGEIYYNLIYNNPLQSSISWNGIDINHDCQNGEVYNNTVYNVHGNCFVIDDATAACNGWVIYNNIFDATQNGSHSGVEALPWRLNGASITWISDYNQLHPKVQLLGGVQDPVAYDYDGDTYYTLAGWQSAKTQEANSDDADPQCIDAANYNFYLKSSSPCLDAGVDVGLKRDFKGDPIQLPPSGFHLSPGIPIYIDPKINPAPDIGAYELWFKR